MSVWKADLLNKQKNKEGTSAFLKEDTMRRGFTFWELTRKGSLTGDNQARINPEQARAMYLDSVVHTVENSETKCINTSQTHHGHGFTLSFHHGCLGCLACLCLPGWLFVLSRSLMLMTLENLKVTRFLKASVRLPFTSKDSVALVTKL